MNCTEDEEEPGFGIFQRFDDLVAFEVLVFDAGLVGAEALYRDAALALGEQGCAYGGVREEDEHYDSPGGAERCDHVRVNSLQIHEGNIPPMIKNSYFHDGRAPLMCPMA